MSASSAVLVTGSAGRIGQAVVAALASRGLPVRGFDLVSTPGASESLIGSISRAGDVRQAVKGVRAIVHLAATPDDDDFHTQLLPNNIVGVYELLEAAREEGVQRLVLASSGQVVWWQRMRGEDLPIGADVQPTPRGWYAATKVFLEGAGRAFAEAHGRSVIAVRLGWCPRTKEQARELAATEWARDVYLSPGDAGSFFAAAVEVPADIRFAVLYACSRPQKRETYDLTDARRLLGWQPHDTWPQGVEEMLANG